jgi:hypothetical protein
MIPDVMNKVNVIEHDGFSSKNYVTDADSFPNFPGYPKHVSGSSFEGGIYCNMDADNDLEIVFNSVYSIYAWNVDGSNVPGWPKSISPYPLEGAPAFGDIDGDGQGEIVATSHGATSGGTLYAFEKNGTNVAGFPVNHGYSTRTPVLADIDNDNDLEIIINLRLYPVGQVWVYKGDGTVYPGWPKNINHVPASSAAVGDITGDNFPEIIAESYISLYVWNRNGDSLPGFPFDQPNNTTNSYSSPVLADLDGDNIREIIWGTHALSGGQNNVYVLKNNGSILTGWPKSVDYWIYGPPAVGFIDNDNILDIAVGDQVLSPGGPVDHIFAWNKNGVPLSGFPVGPVNAVNNQVALADIDNDNMTELIVDDNTQTAGVGQYLAFNHDGTPLNGWPINTTGTTFFNMPCLVDINNNGILDIIGGAREGATTTYLNVYLWNTGINFNPTRTFNPIWQYNSRHNGVYGDNGLVGISAGNPSVPTKFKLYQNYPNPFNPVTEIKFDVPTLLTPLERGQKGVTLRLVIYDIVGREIARLIDGELSPGHHSVSFDGSMYSSGIYFYRLTAGDPSTSSGRSFVQTKKMMLVK